MAVTMLTKTILMIIAETITVMAPHLFTANRFIMAIKRFLGYFTPW